MLNSLAKSFLLLGAACSCALAAAAEEQLAEAPSLDAEVTDRVPAEEVLPDESSESILSNAPRGDEVSVDEVMPSLPAGPAAGEEAAAPAAPAGEAGAGSAAGTAADPAASAPAAGSEAAETAPAEAAPAEAAPAATAPGEGAAPAEPAPAAPGAGTETAAGAGTAAPAEDPAPAAGDGTDAAPAAGDEKDAAPAAPAPAPAAGGETEGSVPAAAGAPAAEPPAPEGAEPVYEALKRRQKDAAGNRGFYSRAYLAGMYLPYFYNTYELPQELSPFLTLRNVRLDRRGSALVYEIGAADAVGPMDFDGTPQDNKTLSLFCRIARKEGILHRLERIALVFYHGDAEFSEVDLDYLECAGKEPSGAGKRELARESERLDAEFTYAYEAEKGETLSADYLKNRFAPYALRRVGERFGPEEEDPVMTAGDDGSLTVSFRVDPAKAGEVRKDGFAKDRIARTCAIDAYGKWILPRVRELRYVYVNRDTGKTEREIAVTGADCGAPAPAAGQDPETARSAVKTVKKEP